MRGLPCLRQSTLFVGAAKWLFKQEAIIANFIIEGRYDCAAVDLSNVVIVPELDRRIPEHSSRAYRDSCIR